MFGLLLFSSCVVNAEDVSKRNGPGNFYDVRYVDCHDGDTCTFLVPWLPPPFMVLDYRLSGVDTPELSRPKCDAEKALAIKAKTFTVGKLEKAREIDLVNVDDPGIFGRPTAAVVVDGDSLAYLLVLNGLAVPSKGKRVMDWCAEGGKKE